jgi:prepilin-type N-terminal cleavage/methylation domain-containing protein
MKVVCGRIPIKRRRGFSLLELLVALTILAIALIPVAYFYSKSLQMVEQASIRTRALMLAQERLSEIQQMPYEQIHSNVTPTEDQLKLYSNYGPIDTASDDWFGYDFEDTGQWAAMFSYPLPLDYNPYRPQTQGYNNTIGTQHYYNNNPIGGEIDPQVNFNGGGAELEYEYEPIGFMTQKVFNADRSLGPFQVSDVRMMNQRSIPTLEPSLDNGYDYFRTGTREQIDKYEIYGRRTVILDVLPTPRDLDGGSLSNTSPVVGVDGFAPDSDFDGNASAVNPYPAAKGPDNKFQLASRHGTRGKMVIVQVFWLPRNAPSGYIPAEDLNKVELRSFIAASNEDSSLTKEEGRLSRNSYLILTPDE